MRYILNLRVIVIAAIFFLTCTLLHGQNFVIDAGHSSIQSEVNRFEIVPVIGRFNDVSGKVTFDPENIERTLANILIKVQSYTANNAGGEEAVTGAAFLDVAHYPEIRFVLNSISRQDNGLIAKGTLELHGTRREIECPITIKGPMVDLPTRKQSIGIMGSLTIDRTEFGVGKEMKLPNGREIIGKEVLINFVILALAE